MSTPQIIGTVALILIAALFGVASYMLKKEKVD